MQTHTSLVVLSETPALLDKLLRLHGTCPPAHANVDRLIEHHLDRLLLGDLGLDLTGVYARYVEPEQVESVEVAINDALIADLRDYLPPYDGEVVNFRLRPLGVSKEAGPYHLHPGYDLYIEVEPEPDECVYAD